MYLEKWQITEYWQNRLNNLDFLPLQNVRKYNFHNVAKNYDSPSIMRSTRDSAPTLMRLGCQLLP